MVISPLAVAAFILDEHQRCLLLRRSADAPLDANVWELPGGKCEVGETAEAALLREIEEETGLKAELLRAVGTSHRKLPDGRHVAYLFMEARLIAPGEVKLSAGHAAQRWHSALRLGELSQTEVPEYLRKLLRDFAETCRQRLLAPPRHWYDEQVSRFARARPEYQTLEERLRGILEQGLKTLNLAGMVKSRTKALTSFAEKIQRPGKHYVDAMREVTDLCGCQVILQTLGDVAAMNRFIEQNFVIVPEDSEDKLERLDAAEFGYTSRHFVISFKDDPTARRMEIQVRTILQHAWADINHGLSYKNRIKLPRRFQRSFARIAAVLEGADREFETIRTDLKSYATEFVTSYGVLYPPERLEQEIAKYQRVRELDPSNADIALHLARLAMAVERWDLAIEVLRPFAAYGSAEMVRELGVSLCQRHAKNTDAPEFHEGQQLLEEATRRQPDDADAWASLGGAWRRRTRAAAKDSPERAAMSDKARDCYRRALEVDSHNPYALGNYIEYELARHAELDLIAAFGPALQGASERCRLHTDVGVNQPWAWFDLGKFQLLLRNPNQAVSYYARGIATASAAWMIASALTSFDTLEPARHLLPGYASCRELLTLALAWREAPVTDAKPDPRVIIAGYCARDAEPRHRDLLLRVFQGLKRTVLSGGTASGISGLVGELQAAHAGTLQTIGYLPEQLPEGIIADQRYTKLRRTPGNEFSPLDLLAMYQDLTDAGCRPADVRLLVVAGGALSALECELAMAFGVPVGVIDAPGTLVGQRLAETPWTDTSRPWFRILSPDVETVRSFLES